MNLRTPLALLLAATMAFAVPLGAAESNDQVPLRFSYEEGVDNIPPGCKEFETFGGGLLGGEEDRPALEDQNPCHQIATDMNALDSPKIDVLLIVPASPAAERDLRIMRQSIQMWADGIHWMAADMGLDWLADGVEFHIFTHMIDPTGEGQEFTTYPIVDPEIVVIAANPSAAVGFGIGIDPLDALFGMEGPCHGVVNPFDHEAWENLPGFDSHHDGRSGTYVEDCDGAGGNICFAVNVAMDPLAGDPLWTDNVVDFQLFDLVSHEVGHCLRLGHVGDGAEGSWSSVPTNDIMAYDSDPPGVSKCVSSLNVEAFAVPMSRYLDVNGDGVVDENDRVFANDAEGEGDGRPFQVQHPDNHYYASPTREAIDCPQPDFSPVPMSETLSFTPVDVPDRAWLAIQNVVDHDRVAIGPVNLAGQVGGTDAVPAAVVLNLTGQDNVTVPVAADGSWSGNVDLSFITHNTTTVISALWLDDEGSIIDSDRVNLTADMDIPVDVDAVRNALAGPGAKSGVDGEGVRTPGFEAFVAIAVVLAGVALARRRD